MHSFSELRFTKLQPLAAVWCFWEPHRTKPFQQDEAFSPAQHPHTLLGSHENPGSLSTSARFYRGRFFKDTAACSKRVPQGSPHSYATLLQGSECPRPAPPPAARVACKSRGNFPALSLLFHLPSSGCSRAPWGTSGPLTISSRGRDCPRAASRPAAGIARQDHMLFERLKQLSLKSAFAEDLLQNGAAAKSFCSVASRLQGFVNRFWNTKCVSKSSVPLLQLRFIFIVVSQTGQYRNPQPDSSQTQC